MVVFAHEVLKLAGNSSRFHFGLFSAFSWGLWGAGTLLKLANTSERIKAGEQRGIVQMVHNSNGNIVRFEVEEQKWFFDEVDVTGVIFIPTLPFGDRMKGE